MKVLKSFLNLIYTPVLERNDMEKEKDVVQHLTINVLLKNPKILTDVWAGLDRKLRSQRGDKLPEIAENDLLVLRMFGDLLNSPMESLPFYTFLLRQLCGKNRFPYARFVYFMLSKQRVKQDGVILKLEEFQKNPNTPCSQLLEEMLAAYLVLLNQLHSQQIND